MSFGRHWWAPSMPRRLAMLRSCSRWQAAALDTGTPGRHLLHWQLCAQLCALAELRVVRDAPALTHKTICSAVLLPAAF